MDKAEKILKENVLKLGWEIETKKSYRK